MSAGPIATTSRPAPSPARLTPPARLRDRPFRATDAYARDNGYNDYYGYGYGGRDWKTYAARNGLACTPGTWLRGDDGRRYLCQ